ncbi:DUF5615 family PIN-like protein [Brevibacterium album]|uniref:DUF5615 family PIN-like protein n=1 Tax=Brevibacterium album TaxID=417948 RepID=UPI003CCB75C1
MVSVLEGEEIAVAHIRDFEMRDATEEKILRLARAEGFTVVPRDSHFTSLLTETRAHRHSMTGESCAVEEPSGGGPRPRSDRESRPAAGEFRALLQRALHSVSCPPAVSRRPPGRPGR